MQKPSNVSISKEDAQKLHDILPGLFHDYNGHHMEPEDKEFLGLITQNAVKGFVMGSAVLTGISYYVGMRLKVPTIFNLLAASLIGVNGGKAGGLYMVQPRLPELLYLDTAFGADARERFRAESPRSPLLRSTRGMRTLEDFNLDEADINARRSGAELQRPTQRWRDRDQDQDQDQEPDVAFQDPEAVAPKLDDSYFFSDKDFHKTKDDQEEPDSFESDTRQSAYYNDDPEYDNDQEDIVDAWVVDDDDRNDRRYGNNRQQKPARRSRTWDDVRREAAMRGK